MNCLRCGTKLENEEMFCPSCREEFKQFPVDSNTVVILPQQRAVSASKSQPRKLSQEELIKRLRRRNRSQKAVILFLLTLLVAAAVLITLIVKRTPNLPIGQNYSKVTESTAVSYETVADEKQP